MPHISFFACMLVAATSYALQLQLNDKKQVKDARDDFNDALPPADTKASTDAADCCVFKGWEKDVLFTRCLYKGSDTKSYHIPGSTSQKIRSFECGANTKLTAGCTEDEHRFENRSKAENLCLADPRVDYYERYHSKIKCPEDAFKPMRCKAGKSEMTVQHVTLAKDNFFGSKKLVLACQLGELESGLRKSDLLETEGFKEKKDDKWTWTSADYNNFDGITYVSSLTEAICTITDKDKKRVGKVDIKVEKSGVQTIEFVQAIDGKTPELSAKDIKNDKDTRAKGTFTFDWKVLESSHQPMNEIRLDRVSKKTVAK